VRQKKSEGEETGQNKNLVSEKPKTSFPENFWEIAQIEHF